MHQLRFLTLSTSAVLPRPRPDDSTTLQCFSDIAKDIDATVSVSMKETDAAV